jgi:hypothetical protein
MVGISSNVRVAVRVRPPLPREVEGGEFISCVGVSTNGEAECRNGRLFITSTDEPVVIRADSTPTGDASNLRQFGFDFVFGQQVGTEQLYAQCCRAAVRDCLQGVNATIFAYGQTGTGKTFTMLGDPKTPGVSLLAARELFSSETTGRGGVELEVHASYVQIYLGSVTDLLTPEGAPLTNLNVRETTDGVVVNGVTKRQVCSVEDVAELIGQGSKRRKVASTKLNSTSSRSHAVLTLYVSVFWTGKPAETNPMGACEDSGLSDSESVLAELCSGPLEAEVGAFAKLNLVDLAGSERVKDSGAEGQGLRDACGINLSLFYLSGVVQALVSRAPRVPYNNDKLCFLLKDALGGNCKYVNGLSSAMC